MPGLWALLACVPLSEPGRLTPRDAATLDAQWDALVADIEANLEEDQVPGMAVAVVLDGRLAYAGGFGRVRAQADSDPVDVDTLFRWESVSKPHTALAATLLARRGVVDLQDRLVDWLPGFDTDPGGAPPEAITLQHLIEHTGGVPTELPWRCDVDDDSLVTYYDQPMTWPLWLPSGVAHDYSNTGYGLLGASLQQATGTPFPDLMDEVLFEPLGMRTATFRADEAVLLPHAVGHVLVDEEQEVPDLYFLDEWDCARTRPAAMLHASVLDLGRLMQSLVSGGDDALPADILAGLGGSFDTRWRGDGSHRVGGGFFGYPFKGVDLWTHNGWAHGFDSELTLVPDLGFGVAVVTNASWGSAHGIRSRAMERFLGLDPLEERIPAYTDPETWTRYEGTYEQPWSIGPDHAQDTTIEVWLQDRTLWVRFDAVQTEVPLVQVDGDAFDYVLDTQPWSIRFVEAADGSMYWVHRNYVAARVAPEQGGGYRGTTRERP